MRASWIRWTVMSLFISMRLVAQDTSRVALVIGLHGPGVLLPISSTTAFRLDGSVSRSGTSDVHVWNEGLGMSALFYLQRWDALRTFIGPRVSYSVLSGTGTTKTWSGQVFFGTEYALGRRFGVFGELGLSYARTTGTRVGIAGESIPVVPSTFWFTTSGVGLLFRL